jgi:signal transduction histidine kinase
MLDQQLQRLPLGELETQRYLAFVRRWGGLRGWLILLLALLLVVLAGFAATALTGWPLPLTLTLSLLVGWVGLGVWVGWLLPSLTLRRRPRGWRGWSVVLGLTLLGGLVGWLIGWAAARWQGGPGPGQWRIDLPTDLPWLVPAALGAVLLVQLLMVGPARLRSRLDQAEAQRLRDENQAQRQLLELAQVREREQQLQIALAHSRLQVLRAQVEPHFIFNTLGAAQQLAEQRSAEAAPLIAQLIRFLRAAMPQLRRSDTCVGEERVLVEAYLGIMQTRLGARLRWRIEAEPGLDDCRIPPALLLTLVENAVKHGIEPCCTAAEVTVSVRRLGTALQLQVADTGVGLGEASMGSSGVGLANLRAQLTLLHGDAASLSLGENAPQGFVATVSMPCRRDPADLPADA